MSENMTDEELAESTSILAYVAELIGEENPFYKKLDEHGKLVETFLNDVNLSCLSLLHTLSIEERHAVQYRITEINNSREELLAFLDDITRKDEELEVLKTKRLRVPDGVIDPLLEFVIETLGENPEGVELNQFYGIVHKVILIFERKEIIKRTHDGRWTLTPRQWGFDEVDIFDERGNVIDREQYEILKRHVVSMKFGMKERNL